MKLEPESESALAVLYLVPRGCKPEMNMMYAGSKLSLVSKVTVVVVAVTMALQVGLQHVFEVRELEELTEDWLTGKLAKS